MCSVLPWPHAHHFKMNERDQLWQRDGECVHERGEPRRMKQSTVFDILQLGLIRIINCCSFASGMKRAKPKTSGSMELEGGGRSHQLHRQLARRAPVPAGNSTNPRCLRTPCHNHTFLRPACCHGPDLQLHGLTHTSLHSRDSPGTGAALVPAAARPFVGAFMKTLFNCLRTWSIMQTNFTENEEKRKP